MTERFIDDLRRVPFSRRGNPFALRIEEGELRIRDVRREGSPRYSGLFRLLLDHEEFLDIDADIIRNHISHLEIGPTLAIAMGSESSLHLHSKAPSLTLEALLTRYDTLHPLNWKTLRERYPSLPEVGTAYEFHSYKIEAKYLLLCLEGQLSLDAPWKSVGHEYCKLTLESNPVTGTGELCLIQYRTVPSADEVNSVGTFEAAKLRAEEDYATWGYPVEQLPGNDETKELASYILWANEIAPCGLITRPAIYMSKNYMANIWSWDNVFNAMALVHLHPQLALDQFMIFTDHQDASGAYPDFINTESLSFGCVKPPVHAWALARMVERVPSVRTLDDYPILLKSIVRNLDYWFEHRRLTSSLLPWYKHGNDSGWDNASLFQLGMPVQAPDLAVHLIRSCELLHPLLREIGELSEAQRLEEMGEGLFDVMMQELHDEDGFFARSLEGEILPRTSLLLRYPILILSKLEPSIQAGLLEELKEVFIVFAGVSTEDERSEYYREDGYWLGPVWAPSTYLIYDALWQYGKDPEAPHRVEALRLAKFIANGFRWACESSGMAENYHPITAVSQSDPAFAWPSSVYLMLLEDEIKED